MHSLVEQYKVNKDAMNVNYVLASHINRIESNPMLSEVIKDERYKTFCELCSDLSPFDELMNKKDELSEDDLTFVVDNMPSGWHRSVLMDTYEEKLQRKSLTH